MYIHEAVKKALEKDCYITTEECKDAFKMKPTNTSLGVIACNPVNDKPIITKWQPTAYELTQDDYILVP